jgi:hypothetical protein
MSIFRRLAATAVLLASIAGITGCEGISVTDRRPYKYDTPLIQRLDEFHRPRPSNPRRGHHRDEHGPQAPG